jgi:VIT1/CCC1 family predicted Fe2+/Mn2+ transporter
MIELRRLSFGGPAAIVTGMGLIMGFDAATLAKSTIIISLLLFGIADNLTDSLSVHIYQESERLAQRDAFRTTVANFFTRFFVCVTFILILLLLPSSIAIFVSAIWGFILLSVLSYFLARTRGVGAVSEILKHCAVAVAVIAISRAIGAWLPAMLG